MFLQFLKRAVYVRAFFFSVAGPCERGCTADINDRQWRGGPGVRRGPDRPPGRGRGPAEESRQRLRPQRGHGQRGHCLPIPNPTETNPSACSNLREPWNAKERSRQQRGWLRRTHLV